MKRKIFCLMAGVSLVFFASAAHADVFSVAADVPLQYSFDDGGSADDVSGFKLAVSLPFLVGIGVEQYTATVESPGLSTDVDFSIVDVFVNLPVPIINLGLGIGLGSASVEQTPATAGQTFEDADIFQYFVTLGYPIAVLFDVHLGYHVVGGTSDIKQSGSKVGEAKLDGNMLSLGIKIGF
jgi:hypothetical protein